jgi:hypothetical protein
MILLRRVMMPRVSSEPDRRSPVKGVVDESRATIETGRARKKSALRQLPAVPCLFAGLRRAQRRAATTLALGLGALTLATVLLPARVASADESPDYYIRQLKTGDDFRVRVQAALALGKKGDAAFASPLCGALDDGNEAVRAAAAGALGKLTKASGVPCLTQKLASEKNADVRATMEKSLKDAKSAGGGSEGSDGGAIPANAKFYVAVGDVNNKTKRSKDEVDQIVKSALSSKLATMPGYAVAPRGESSAKAKSVMQSKRLKGFQLITTVEPPEYSGGSLTVKVRVVLTSYPGKEVKGEFTNKLTQSGTPTEDKASEDELIKMNLERALDSFQKVVAAM